MMLFVFAAVRILSLLGSGPTHKYLYASGFVVAPRHRAVSSVAFRSVSLSSASIPASDPENSSIWAKVVIEGSITDLNPVEITPIPLYVDDLKKAVVAAFPDALREFGSTQLDVFHPRTNLSDPYLTPYSPKRKCQRLPGRRSKFPLIVQAKRSKATSASDPDPDTTSLWAKVFIDGSNMDLEAFVIDPVPKDVSRLKDAVIAKAKQPFGEDIVTVNVFPPGTSLTDSNLKDKAYRPGMLCANLPFQTTDENPLIVTAIRRTQGKDVSLCFSLFGCLILFLMNVRLDHTGPILRSDNGAGPGSFKKYQS
jgi:hypothetical protein